MDGKDEAPEVEPKKDLKAPRTVKVRYVDEIPHTGAVGRLNFGEVVLARGKEVEVSPEIAKGIKAAFGGRYEIEEV